MIEDRGTEITINTASLTNLGGRRLFCKYWEPPTTKALVFIVHGYAEHCLLYDHLARVLATDNFYVFAHDHVGHGQSEGTRAQIGSFDKYVSDVFMHADMIRRRFPDLPLFLCGHSMGGAISIHCSLERPDYFHGMVLIAPAVTTNPEIATPFRIAVAKILRWVAPNFPVQSLDLRLLSSSPIAIKMMKEDPLRYHGYCKAKFGAALISSCKEIQKRIAEIKTPFTILQGEEDKLCIPEGAVLVYEKATSEDKSIKMYPNAAHSLLAEPNGIAEQVVADTLKWLNDHI